MSNKKQQVPQNDVCNIAAGTVIEGDVKMDVHARLEGKIYGNLICKGRLVMSKTAYVEGDVICIDLITEGKILGDITVSQSVLLKASAEVRGDLSYDRLQIESGAILNGKCTRHEGTFNINEVSSKGKEMTKSKKNEKKSN
ncbi:MAG: polymer-forming cytoskeletal protein [Saprospiraceae bacterium]|nr:polymer-forming cytoskeletal protein [Saprospiraceae bacterium]